MRKALVVAAAGLLALASCGGAGGSGSETPRPASAVVINTVIIGFTRDPDELPFNPRAARLQQATQQLTAIAGHPVTFQFDVALLPQWQSSFESALIDAIENVARDLQWLHDNDAAEFRFGDPAFKRVECSYVAVPSRDKDAFDPDSGTLRIHLSSEDGQFVPRDEVLRELREAYWQSLDRRFGNVEPEQADDVDLYFKWITNDRNWGEYVDLGTQEGLAKAPRAVRIGRVARLFPRLAPSTSDGSSYVEARKWLAKQVDFFADTYAEHEAAVRSSPATSAFHRAEAAWVAWLGANVDRLPQQDRFEVVDRLAVERRGDREHPLGQGHYVDIAFPGFDYLAYAMKVTDEWAAAGHPMKSEDAPDRMLLFIHVACPAPRDAYGRHSSFFSCNHTLYEYAMDRDPSMKTLAAYLLARKDPAITEAAFVDLIRLREQGTYGATVNLWRALEGDPAQWRVATGVVADQVGIVPDVTLLYDEAQRQWRALPAQRGATLYLVALIQDEAHRDLVDWKSFARTFGSQATETDFAGFLDQSAMAPGYAASVWPALTAGWSRAAVIVPRLDRFLDLERNVSTMAMASRSVDGIVSRMCDDHAARDIAQMHAYLERRVSTHASEQKDLETLLYRTTPGHCSSGD
ncbi:MAG TPA: hypothetical protein VMI75_01795 [Polyangiaceae bacterium]|nr:hypothetical protein [Polyangiaceae bacterium]